MRWRLQFYNERRGLLARYSVEAPLPAAATRFGWDALRAEHPPPRRKKRPGLFELAERAGGQDPSGWVLYRIVQDGQPGSGTVTGAPAT